MHNPKQCKQQPISIINMTLLIIYGIFFFLNLIEEKMIDEY